jgi:hypothetical protein
MGVTVTNILIGFHAFANGAGGATEDGWSIRLHHEANGWNVPSGVVSSADFFDCVTASKASQTAAASALASTWPAWWGNLTSAQRTSAAEVWHAAVGQWP